MKKKICLLLVLCIMTSLCACGSSKKNKSDNSDLADLFLSGETKKKNKEKATETTKETTTEEDNKIKIDPFEDLKVTFLGASPFLRINIDNSKCSDIVQYKVNYDYDDKNYRIGDKVTVWAKLYNDYYSSGTDEYELEDTSKVYEVEDTAEWLTSIDNIDMTEINKEIEDKLAACTTETIGDYDFGGVYLGGGRVSSIGQAKLRARYFVTLKPSQYNSFDSFSSYSKFNYYVCIYDFDIGLDTHSDEKNATVTCGVILSNIEKDTDGTLRWDTSLDYSAEKNNYDKVVNDEVTSKRDNYNVTEITE